MPVGDEQSWRSHFLGREAEMARLREAWEQARGGRPQFVVLLAESGFGKTRLVQEFYRYLSQHADAPDPEGYWPDTFLQKGESMEVNPTFPAGQRWPDDAAPPRIPWLWWGIRFSQPGDRKQRIAECGIERHLDRLEPHLAPLLWATQKRELEKKGVIRLGTVLLGFTPAQILLGLKDGWEALAELKQSREIEQQERLGIGAREGKKLQDLTEQLLGAFQSFLQPKARDASPVPVILVLDDAQWADADTLNFVELLMTRACRQGWPLLVVATHYEREWHEDYERPMPDVRRSECLADVACRLSWAFPEFAPLPVGKVAKLDKMLTEALPGLTPSQAELILNRADGNPLFLLELIELLRSEPAQFRNRDVKQPLTYTGEAQVGSKMIDLYAIIRKRFASLDTHLKDVLGWSSYQGDRFLRSLTLAVPRAAEVQPCYPEEQVKQALERAHHPIGFIQNEGEDLSVFRQAAFHEVAKSYLELNPENLEKVRAAVRRTLMELLRNGQIDELHQQERLYALQLAARELRNNDTRI